MEASRILYKLRDKDIQKASVLFGVDEYALKTLNDLALLNSEYIRDKLIKNDYEKLTRGLKFLIDQNGAYTFPEIREALMKEYGVNSRTLNSILRGKNNSSLHFCKKCGIRVSSMTYKRTGGLCSNCFADTLEL